MNQPPTFHLSIFHRAEVGPRGFMAVVRPPAAGGVSLSDFCTAHSGWVEGLLLAYGGILFRGWNVSTVG